MNWQPHAGGSTRMQTWLARTRRRGKPWMWPVALSAPTTICVGARPSGRFTVRDFLRRGCSVTSRVWATRKRRKRRAPSARVAQSCTLPYRRFVICVASPRANVWNRSDTLPNMIRRYGRLKICATRGATALNRDPGRRRILHRLSAKPSAMSARHLLFVIRHCPRIADRQSAIQTEMR